MSPLCRGLLLAAGLAWTSGWGIGGEQPADRAPKKAPVDQAGDPLPAGARARLGTARFRHGGPVMLMTFAPDGKALASTSGEGTILVWETATGREIAQFKGRPVGPGSLAFLGDGKTLALVGDDGSVQVWEVAGGARRHQWAGPVNGIQSLAFAPRGRTTVVLGGDQTIRLVETATGKEAAVLAGPAQPQNGAVPFSAAIVAISPDGKVVVAGGGDNANMAVRFWDADTGRELPRWNGPQNQGIVSLAFSPDGQTLAVRDGSQTTRLVAVGTGKEIRALTGRGNQFNGFSDVFSPNGQLLATTSGDQVILEDVAGGKEARRFAASHSGVTALAFGPDGKTLATGGGNHLIRLWDAATGKELRPTFGHQGDVLSIACSPDGRVVATVSMDQTVRLWEASTGKEVRRLARGVPVKTQSDEENIGLPAILTFAPDGKTLAAAWTDGFLQLWDAATGKERGHFQDRTDSPAFSMVFSPDGRVLATGAQDGMVRLRAVDGGREMRQFPVFKNLDRTGQPGSPVVAALAFSPDGKSLAAGGYDFNPQLASRGLEAAPGLRLVEVATGRERRNLPLRSNSMGNFGSTLGIGLGGGNFAVLGALAAVDADILGASGGVSATAFAPDGKMLAVGGGSMIQLVDLARGRAVRRFGSNQLLTGALAFSPDGKMLAAGSYEGTVCVWETATGTELAECAGHRGGVLCVRFSPDGKLLLSSGADTTALVWDVAELVEARQREIARPSPAKLEALWRDLADADAAKAYAAVLALTAAPEPAVALLRDRLRPVPAVDARRVEKLIGELEDNQYDVRRRATAELEKMDTLPEEALRRTLQSKPSLEVTRRVEALLEKLQGPVVSPETLRGLRAVEVLEGIGTPEARSVLENLARGEAQARLTRDARGALERLRKTHP